MLSKKEINWLKALGGLYVKTFPNMTCGGGAGKPVYVEFNIEEYLEECRYKDNLDNYMKYRTQQRYYKEFTCGGYEMRPDNKGEFVRDENGRFINLRDLSSQLRPEDIRERVLKYEKEHKNNVRFSWNDKVMGSGSFIPDPNGNYIWDQDLETYVNINQAIKEEDF